MGQAEPTGAFPDPGRADGDQAAALVANGLAYAATQGVHAFDAAAGALLWHQPTADIVNFAPAIVDGVFYVADFSGTMTAYALPLGGA